MDLIDILSRAQGGTLRSAGAQFGLSDEQARLAFDALAPVIASGMRRNVDGSADGFVSLLEALSRGRHDRYLDDAEAVRFDNARDDGNAILGHVFGSPDVSRAIAMQASQATGIGADVLKKMLPVVAGMVMAGLAKSMLGGRGAPASGQGGGLGDILGDLLGGGAGRSQRGTSASPGGLGDILTDLLGAAAGRGGQGGGLGDILGQILGGQAGRRGDDAPASRLDEDQLARGRDIVDDMLGRGTARGTAADDLLRSVERHLGRR